MLQKYTSAFIIVNFKKDEQQRVLINTNAHSNQEAATNVYNHLKSLYSTAFIAHEGTADLITMCSVANQLKSFIYLKHS